MQGILTPIFGTDGALWSLANEFWYYILFPLLVLLLRPGTPLLRRALYAVLLAAAAWLVRGGILEAFPIWLFGVLLYRLAPPRLSQERAGLVRLLATVVFLLSFFALSRVTLISGMFNDYVLGVITTAYLWLLLSNQEGYKPEAWGVRCARASARFSFTLYLVHTPLLLFLFSLLAGDTRWVPGWSNAPVVFGLFVMTLAYAYGVAYLTEFRTDDVRMWLQRQIGTQITRSALSSDPATEAVAK